MSRHRTGRMRRAVRGAASALAILAAVACGCAAPGCRLLRGTPQRVVVTHLGGDAYGVAGQRVTLAELSGALRARGCGPNTAIEVSISASTPRSTFGEVNRNLAAAGFRKVMFVRPQHVDAYVGKPRKKPE